MSGQLTDHELARRQLLKAVTTTIRLKYSLLADAELNELRPRIAAEFDKAIASGQPYELATSSLLLDLEDADQ